MDIQWYPGHMAKAKRLIAEDISLIDVVIELLDARIPYSSQNPDIDKLVASKKRIVVLNKSDIADEKVNALWAKYFMNKGINVIETDSTTGKGIAKIPEMAKNLMKEKIENQRSKGRIFVPVRAMILGIPNVGKSTLINKLTRSSITKTGDRPGVTKSKQWVQIRKDFQLLDTPGILWPKFSDVSVGNKLAFTGAIKDDILDKYTLSLKLIETLLSAKKDCIGVRYKIENYESEPADKILEMLGKSRGFITKGGETDLGRAATILLDEYRGAKLGKISLETPEVFDVN